MAAGPSSGYSPPTLPQVDFLTGGRHLLYIQRSERQPPSEATSEHRKLLVSSLLSSISKSTPTTALAIFRGYGHMALQPPFPSRPCAAMEEVLAVLEPAISA